MGVVFFYYEIFLLSAIMISHKDIEFKSSLPFFFRKCSVSLFYPWLPFPLVSFFFV